MEAAYLVWNYACTVVRVFARRFEADYRLTGARTAPGGEDVTAGAMAALASDDRAWFRDNGVVVIEYTYKGVGPYRYAVDARSDTGPPLFPPAAAPSRDIVPPEEQVIMAERSFNGEEADVTEDITAFAGPDGTFHGSRLEPGASWGDFDAEGLVGPGDYTLTLANGDVVFIEGKGEDL